MKTISIIILFLIGNQLFGQNENIPTKLSEKKNLPLTFSIGYSHHFNEWNANNYYNLKYNSFSESDMLGITIEVSTPLKYNNLHLFTGSIFETSNSSYYGNTLLNGGGA